MTIERLIRQEIGLRGLVVLIRESGWIRIEDKYCKDADPITLFSMSDNINTIKGVILEQRKK